MYNRPTPSRLFGLSYPKYKQLLRPTVWSLGVEQQGRFEEQNLLYSSYSLIFANGWLTWPPQDRNINPSNYTTLDEPEYSEPHATGEVWAQMLWIVLQRLVAKHGFSDNLFPPTPLPDGTIPTGDFYRLSHDTKTLVPKHGNTLLIQYV